LFSGPVGLGCHGEIPNLSLLSWFCCVFSKPKNLMKFWSVLNHYFKKKLKCCHNFLCMQHFCSLQYQQVLQKILPEIMMAFKDQLFSGWLRWWWHVQICTHRSWSWISSRQKWNEWNQPNFSRARQGNFLRWWRRRRANI